MRIFLMLALLFAGCSTAEKEHQKLNPATFYKKDMIITVNGVTEEGVITAPVADQYNIEVETPGDLDAFFMETCHKDALKERAWNVTKVVRSGLFGWGSKKIDVKNKVSFTYYPTAIEKDKNCVLELKAAEEGSEGRHSTGTVSFETPRYALDATVACNGITRPAHGVFECQAKVGSYQQITFGEDVVFASNNCGIPEGESKSPILFKVQSTDLCTAIAMGKDSKKRFSFFIYGYTEIAIRE